MGCFENQFGEASPNNAFFSSVPDHLLKMVDGGRTFLMQGAEMVLMWRFSPPLMMNHGIHGLRSGRSTPWST